MKKYKNGLFISFEGPEASGKSTQIKLLKKHLIKNKIKFVATREPGGTIISEKLRKIILNKSNHITITEEILLLMTARKNHIDNIIKPALSKGKLVISDRYADSTFVYQGFVNKFGLVKSQNLHKQLLNNFLPKKTFLFLLSAKEINERLRKRKYFNKYDKIDINFHKKVLEGYNKLCNNNSRFSVINAKLPQKIIHQQIIRTISRFNTI